MFARDILKLPCHGGVTATAKMVTTAAGRIELDSRLRRSRSGLADRRNTVIAVASEMFVTAAERSLVRQAASRIFNDRDQLPAVRAGPIERQLGNDLWNGHDSCARLVHALQCQI